MEALVNIVKVAWKVRMFDNTGEIILTYRHIFLQVSPVKQNYSLNLFQ